MTAAWSDSDSSYSEDKAEHVANLCFMVNENHVQEHKTKYESLDKVDYTYLLEYSKDELAQTLTKCI